jgi:putative ABC transport system permease protein
MGVAGDICFGARLLRKSPGFTALALAALALGMGATTAIFSVVDTVLLKPLPFRDPDRLLAVWEKDPALNRDRNYVAPVNYLEWQRQSRTVSSFAGIHNLRVNIDGGLGQPEEVKAERVSAELFPMLGVQPAIGRTFQAEEDRPGRATVAIIGHNLWQRRFSGNHSITGQSLRIRGRVYSIVGVLPPGFAILEPGVEVWIPLGLDPADQSNNGRYITVIGRMRDSVSLAGVKREMEALGAAAEKALPAINTGWSPSVFRLQDELTFDVRRPLWVLMSACGMLLVMACVNVANLLLVRGSARRKELALRAALGAPRGRLIGQLLSESLLLAAGGGIAGLLLGWGAVTMVARFGPAAVPRLAQVSLNPRLFLFALAASAISGLVAGAIPALHGSRGDLGAVMNEGGRGGTSGRTGRAIRQSLAVLQIAIAVVMLIGAGLLMRSFIRLRAANPGFDPSGILTLRMPLGGRMSTAERRAAFTETAMERIASLPGVQGVAVINGLPLDGLGNGADFVVDGRPGPPPVRHPNGLVRSVSPNYFRILRIPLISGRFFTNADNLESKPVILVNRTLARQFWPNGNPLGERLVVQTNSTSTRTAEIVGVVGDVKPERFEGEDWPMIYHPNAQVPSSGVTLVVRTSGPPTASISAVSSEVHRLDPEQVLANVRPMETVVDHAVAGARFNTALLVIFAGIAFVLASVGIYGVISYDVGERTNEIGIRIALGAMPEDVLRMVLAQGARLAAAGIAIGLAGAFALTRLMATMLYGVDPADALTFGLISILLAAVALAASFLPSRRAMSLDPVAALRHE